MQPSDLNPDWVKRAKVGDKIVCVGADTYLPAGVELLHPLISPEVGMVYTIRAIQPSCMTVHIGLKLEEIADQMAGILLHGRAYRAGVIFPAWIFRPVERRPTDISMFTMLLDTLPVEAPSEAVPA